MIIVFLRKLLNVNIGLGNRKGSSWHGGSKRKTSAKEQQYSCSFAADQDETFFHIAGYTSGGAPYGVTWKEMGISVCEELEENDSLEMLPDELEDDCFK